MENFEEIHIEKDFWDDFIVEAFEHIDAIESNAMSLEQNPEDMEIIHTMFRAFHTIKGLSGFVEHTIIQEIAHKTETMMDLCRKGELKVSTPIVNAILKSSDYIKQLCNDVESYKDPDFINKIQEQINILEELAQVEPTNPEPAINSEECKPIENQAEQESVNMDFPSPESNQNFEGEQPVQQENFEQQEVSSQQENNEWQEPLQQQSNEGQPEENIEQQNTVEQQENIQIQENNEQQNQEQNDQFVQQESCEAQEQPTVFEPTEQQQEEQPQEQLEPTDVPINPESGIEPPAQNVFEFGENKEENVNVTQVEQKELSQEEKALKSFQKEIIAKLGGVSSSAVHEQSKENSSGKAASANEEYMKVANYKIDHLVDMIGELIINQSLIEQYVSTKYNDDKQLITNMSGFLRITRELQSLSMSLRMVSLKSTFQKLTRVARDTIQELHKDVEFVTSGETTEIDRVVTEKLLDPLVHMIKNAISHGVEENPQDRINIGKPSRARVELNAYSKRGKIFIEVKDDGRGINTEVVYQKALEKGIADPNKTYSDAEIKEFIMLPGFSTAKVVDNISGRGVGMDVVRTQILKTGGKVGIDSNLNQGSTFTLEVPVNHAIMNGTIIEMQNQHFVVPTVNVKEFLQPLDNQWIFTQQERTMIKVRDNIIPIIPHSLFFKNTRLEENTPLVMILELDQELKALPITNVLNRQEVVVKPVSEEFSSLKYISGMSILGTGKVSLILDIDYLFKKEVKE